MHEKLVPLPTATLSPELTRVLLSHERPPGLVAEVEQAANAYFWDGSDEFLGILPGSMDKGPEKPFFQPGPEDRNDVVQAIALFGVEADYWQRMSDCLHHESIDVARMFSAMAIPAFLQPNGSAVILLSEAHVPTTLHIVTKVKDRDFFWYLSEKPAIPPVSEKRWLGFTQEATYQTWEQWSKLQQTYSSYYNDAVFLLKERTDLPKNTGKFLMSYYDMNKERGFAGPTSVEYAISPLSGTTPESNQVIKAANENMRKLVADGDPKGLLATAEALATKLRTLYETAREYRRDVYRY